MKTCKRCDIVIKGKIGGRRTFCTPYCQATYWEETHPERAKQNRDRYNARQDVRLMKRIWKEKRNFNGNATLIDKKCKLCDSKKDLIIHHIDGNNGRLGKKLNNSASNLLVLCRSCHPKIHNKWWRKDIDEAWYLRQ